jgi:hypothetical protein
LEGPLCHSDYKTQVIEGVMSLLFSVQQFQKKYFMIT